MKGILLRWLILTCAIMVAAYLLDGIKVTGFSSALFTAAILGILNAFFRPILFDRRVSTGPGADGGGAIHG